MRFTRLILILVAAGCALTAARSAGEPPAGSGEGSCMESGCHGEFAERATVHAPVEGEMCESCHQHGGEGHGFKLLSDEIGELCMACHEDPGDSMESAHAPVAGGECTSCHDPHGSEHESLLMASTEELCVTCHEDPTDSMNSVHAPAAGGECTTCHAPHGSEHESLLTASAEELCLACHEAPEPSDDPAQMVHMPAAEGMCTSCHSPHGSEQEALLNQKGKEVCLACHDGVGEGMASTHGIIETGGCHTCHDPHGPAGPTLLRGSGNELCMACHGPRVVAEGEEAPPEVKLAALMGMEEAAIKLIPRIILDHRGRGHPSVKHPVSTESDPRNPEAPFWCGSCHAPHGSPKKKLLVGGEGFGLCAQCHKK